MIAKAKRYSGQKESIMISGMLLYILIFPILLATFFALVRGDVREFLLNFFAYIILFSGVKIAKKGFLNEKKYNSSKLSLAPKHRYKLLGSIVLGVGSFFTSYFCVQNSLLTSIMLSLATTVGFLFYYGLDPLKDKVNSNLPQVTKDAIEVIEEVKEKLNELEKISYNLFDKNIKESLNIIIEEIEDLVTKVENDPKILSKVRKFFKVYLKRVVFITKEFANLKPEDKNIQRDYQWMLEELKNTITEQKRLLEKKDLVGLEIQIEALSKQLKEEGV